MLREHIHEAIGDTPLVRLRLGGRPGPAVYAKLELANPFGMKDRVARNIIRSARRVGALAEGAPIVESSSGTMALGVALVGRSMGHPVHIVTDPRVDRLTLTKLRSLGCEVHVVDRMTSHGWQSARLERLEELMAGLPGAFWPRQYSNPDNPGAYRDLAEEILADLGPIDVLVGSTGSGGSLCGTARPLRAACPGLRVVGVDCVGSALFGQTDRAGRLQSGLGNSLRPQNLDHTLIDEVHWLNDHEAFAATRELAAEQQIFAGNTSGSVYQVLKDVAARSGPGTRIVGIFPDRGDRYVETVYDDGHWGDHDVAALPRAGRSAEVAYGTEVSTWSRADASAIPRDRRHLVFVESNTTGTGMRALELARELDVEPVLLTGRPDRYRGLAETGAEVVVCDTTSLPALREVLQRRFHRAELAGVTTTSDYSVPFAAELAAWLHLPGNSAEAVATCRDKGRLRAALTGPANPRWTRVTDPGQVAAAVAHAGLPCVVKPADESGSQDVVLCSGVEEAVAHAATVLARTVNARGLPTAGAVLVEEYVEGPEYSVEMFSHGGRHHLVGVTAKTVTGGNCFVETQHLFPAAVPASVEQVVRAALEATGFRLGASHTEVRLTAAGPAIIEVNARLAGGMIPELIRRVTGVDLLREQLRAALGLDPELTPDRQERGGIRFLRSEQEGRLVRVEGVDRAQAVPGVVLVAVTAEPGALVGPPKDAYGRLGHLVATGDETEKALVAAENEIRFVVEAR
ncbi:pyridoxal-phosphate dependent enzyme [Herbidospora cretacea]|uniref:pyridoxal-phosphate dependent enzyme n=1 Tax=Herbidospora cretacea TaxID=28444 RepID=UPI000773F81B|nr:pyridoxal-phosphate dependent enzyme [Herbidospora cretacea]